MQTHVKRVRISSGVAQPQRVPHETRSRPVDFHPSKAPGDNENSGTLFPRLLTLDRPPDDPAAATTNVANGSHGEASLAEGVREAKVNRAQLYLHRLQQQSTLFTLLDQKTPLLRARARP